MRVTRVGSGRTRLDLVVLRDSLPGDTGDVDLANVLSVRAVPNPFFRSVSLRLAEPVATAPSVAIFDAAGRLVHTAWYEAADGRALDVTWDGRDDRGREVPAGIYLVRVEGPAGVARGRLVKTRR
jgi:hypothetical protein